MAAEVATWEWQGLTVKAARAAHVIDDISYTGTPNWLRCTDGTLLEAGTAEELARMWQAHGGKVFDAKDIEDRLGAKDSGVDVNAMYAAIATQLDDWAETCTCIDGGPIEDCPNYQPGDEAEGAFDSE